MLFQLIIFIILFICGMTIFFVARKYEKHRTDIKKTDTA